MYGRNARLPIDLELNVPHPADASAPLADLNDRLDTFLKLGQHREYAAQSIAEKQIKQKAHHDKKVKKSVFRPGDEVLLHYSRTLTRKGVN